MSFKPIASTTFYSKKFPEVRIIVPRKGNVSDDSDCTSDDSSMNLGTRDVNWEDVIIPETESECEYESDNESKKNSVKRFGSRRGSVTCDDNVIVPNTESESESDNEPKKKVVKRSGTRKNATCDKSVIVPETDSECESAKAVPRRKRIKSFHITDRYATHTKIPSKASKKLLFTSPPSKPSGTSQSKGKDMEVDDNNNLSSPCVSPTPSLLGDLGVRPIDPANATMRSHSPDLFDETDFLEQSPIVLELSQTSNLPQQNEQLKKSEGRILQQVSVNKSKPNESKENFLFDTDLETPSPLKRARGYDSNNFNQLSDSCGKENSCASKQTSKEIVNKQKKDTAVPSTGILREKRKSCGKNDRTNMSTHTTLSITRSSLPSSVSLVNGDSQTGHQICHARGENGASTKKPGNKETKKKSAPLTNDALKNCGQPSISCGKANSCASKQTSKGRAPRPSKDSAPLTNDNLHESVDESADEESVWKVGDMEEVIRDPVVIEPHCEGGRPIDYFCFFFNEEILSLIVEQSNMYAMQKNGKPLNLKVEELKTFLGIWLFMGVCQIPNLKDYWRSDMRVSHVADCMALKRFQKIRSQLHVADNLDNRAEVVADRYRKVRPLLSHMQNKCRALQQESKLSADEVIVRYKGKYSSLKQYNPKKPTKWGFKAFALAGVSGLIYDFHFYSGSSTFDGCDLTDVEKNMGVSNKSIVTLCKSVKNPESAVIFFDNWFSSVSLMGYLMEEMSILSLGTIRKNRTEHCPFTGDKKFAASGRGTIESFVNSDHGVCAVRWMDSKPVILASTAAGVELKSTVQRFDRAAKKKVDVPCPRIIKLYNQHMGGVDLNDMLVSQSSCPGRSSRRWYFPLIGYMLDLAVTNAYLLYKRDNEILNTKAKDIEFKCAKDFRLDVSKSLRCHETHIRSPIVQNFVRKNQLIKSPTYRPAEEVRYDGFQHWMIFSDSTNRCKNCKTGKTAVMCSKCNLNLCCKSNRNCFLEFHQKK